MNKPKKRWSRYQVDGPQYAHSDPIYSRIKTVKSVSELTEAEAKDGLCDAMDVIQGMLDAAVGGHEKMLDVARKAKYYH